MIDEPYDEPQTSNGSWVIVTHPLGHGYRPRFRTTIETRNTVADFTQLHTELSRQFAHILHECQSGETDPRTAGSQVQIAFAEAVDLPNTHSHQMRYHIEHILVMLAPRARKVFSWLRDQYDGPEHGMSYPASWSALAAVHEIMRGIELMDTDQRRIDVASAIRSEYPEPWPAIRFHDSYPHLSSLMIDLVDSGTEEFSEIRQCVEVESTRNPELKREIDNALTDSGVDWQRVLNEPVVGTIYAAQSPQAARLMARDILQLQKRGHEPKQWV